ncbi:hypothetical protein PVIIG_05267 [Plasmodium vivax India VII]|uniref:Uncharacterized protein n=1 Tax=Plasmodium vivax India VII TaxID=1077284 RepID=A0A0J9SLY5_PLAVI|nr:hypothetical protein PVIIG_05267 [Plasmodium vivax India VII]
MIEFIILIKKFPDLALKIFDSGSVNDGQIEKDCRDFKSTKLTTYKGEETQFINNCKKTVNYLDKIKEVEPSKTEYFKYINYWLYDTLKDMDPFPYKELLDTFYTKITKFKDYQTYKKPINAEIYKGLKELYDLYEHLKTYKTESTGSSSISCNHGDKCAELYESYVGKCKWVYNPDYCSSLKKFRDEYETHRTNENKCLKSMKYLTTVGYNPEAHFLIAIFAMSIITFVFIYFYKVCNSTILNIF